MQKEFKKFYNKVLLKSLLMIIWVGLIWIIGKDIIWLCAMVISWIVFNTGILYLYCSKKIYIYSRYVYIITMLSMVELAYFFNIIAGLCSYLIYGNYGLIIIGIILIIGIYLLYNQYIYSFSVIWDRNKNKYKLSLPGFNVLKDFNMKEDSYSVEVLNFYILGAVNIVPFLFGGIALFYKRDIMTIFLMVALIMSSIVIFGIVKHFTKDFFIYRRIRKWEKETHQSIIN